jgi:micrococcal nuclease
MGFFMFEYFATVVRVVDGDTIDAVVDLGFAISFKARFRLARINCPELKTHEGKVVQRIVESLIVNKKVKLLSLKDGKDKYGRYLAEVVLENGINLNTWLIETEYATEYLL